MRDGWTRMRLDDATEVTIGRQRSPRHATGTHLVPYMRAANVKDGALQLADVLEMNFTPKEQAVYNLRAGDVLVTEGCGSIRELGASARWTAGLPGVVCFQNTLLRLRARAGVALPEFIEQWARWAHATGIWAGVGSGTNIFHIGVQRAREVPIDLPPLPEQRRIVDLVTAVGDAIDASCQARDDALSLSKSLRTSTFDDESVKPVELGALCAADGIQIGPFGSQLHASDYVEDGIPTVMPKDIVDGRINVSTVARVSTDDWKRLAKHHLRRGDIVLPRRGDLTKRAFVHEEQAGWLCGTGSVRVRVTKADPVVVFEALSTRHVDRWLQDHAVGVTMPNLNSAIVSAIPVRLPEDGDAVARVLDQLREYESRMASAIERLRALRGAVLDDLLSGRREIPDSYDALLESA